MSGRKFAQRVSKLWVVVFLGIASFALAQQPAQVEESRARGAFLITRKSPTPTPTPKLPSGPQSPRSPGDVSKNKSGSKTSRPAPSPATNAPAPDVAAATPAASAIGGAAPIGMGYTLYQRNGAGEAERVSPTKSFYQGDQVRFVLEPNVDGYLYIFVSTGDGAPEMLFPNPSLNDGMNSVQAHVPYETPSRDAKIKWFTFDADPGVERLFIVVSRAPLSNVPTGKELAAYCKGTGEECAWKPTPQLFSLVLNNAEAPKIASASKLFGQTQAQVETEAITRGIKLKPDAPEPALVQMNVSGGKDILVMKTELIHRLR